MNLGSFVRVDVRGRRGIRCSGGVSYQVRGMSHYPDSQVRQTLGLTGVERVAEDSSDRQFISRVRRAFDVGRCIPG